jgi:glutaredoxin
MASKALLKRNGVAFEEFDVASDKEKASEMFKKVLTIKPEARDEIIMPVLDIEGIIIEGFNREKIKQALKKKGLEVLKEFKK